MAITPHTAPGHNMPQPPPNAVAPGSVAVWPSIAALYNKSQHLHLRNMMEARNAFGIKKYGVPLHTLDGRDTQLDAIEEALDLVAYLGKMVLESEGKPISNRHAIRCFNAARDLLEEIAEI